MRDDHRTYRLKIDDEPRDGFPCDHRLREEVLRTLALFDVKESDRDEGWIAFTELERGVRERLRDSQFDLDLPLTPKQRSNLPFAFQEQNAFSHRLYEAMKILAAVNWVHVQPYKKGDPRIKINPDIPDYLDFINLYQELRRVASEKLLPISAFDLANECLRLFQGRTSIPSWPRPTLDDHIFSSLVGNRYLFRRDRYIPLTTIQKATMPSGLHQLSQFKAAMNTAIYLLEGLNLIEYNSNYITPLPAINVSGDIYTAIDDHFADHLTHNASQPQEKYIHMERLMQEIIIRMQRWPLPSITSSELHDIITSSTGTEIINVYRNDFESALQILSGHNIIRYYGLKQWGLTNLGAILTKDELREILALAPYENRTHGLLQAQHLIVRDDIDKEQGDKIFYSDLTIDQKCKIARDAIKNLSLPLPLYDNVGWCIKMLSVIQKIEQQRYGVRIRDIANAMIKNIFPDDQDRVLDVEARSESETMTRCLASAQYLSQANLAKIFSVRDNYNIRERNLIEWPVLDDFLQINPAAVPLAYYGLTQTGHYILSALHNGTRQYLGNPDLECVLRPYGVLGDDRRIAERIIEILRTGAHRDLQEPVKESFKDDPSMPKDAPPWGAKNKSWRDGFIYNRVRVLVRILIEMDIIDGTSGANGRWYKLIHDDIDLSNITADVHSGDVGIGTFAPEAWMAPLYRRLGSSNLTDLERGDLFEHYCADIIEAGPQVQAIARLDQIRERGSAPSRDIQITTTVPMHHEDDTLIHIAECKNYLGKNPPGAVAVNALAGAAGPKAEGTSVLIASGDVTRDPDMREAINSKWIAQAGSIVVIDGGRLTEFIRQTRVGLIVNEDGEFDVDQNYFDELERRVRKFEE